MTNTRRIAAVVMGLAGIAGGLAGCVSQGEYDRAAETANSALARQAELARERDEAQKSLDAVRGRITQSETTISELSSKNSQLQSQLDAALAEYKNLEARMQGFAFGAVDPVTNDALAALASQYSDLMTYDSARGMLRFNADLTFDSGKAVVKSQAKNALAALAQIVNSPSAMQYDVVIEGHTDSQNIRNPETLRNHPTNRHLSAHRAIAVLDELATMGVAQSRVLAAGWGETKPLVVNNANGNTPQNRRVEIYLAKPKGGTSSLEPTAPAVIPAETTYTPVQTPAPVATTPASAPAPAPTTINTVTPKRTKAPTKPEEIIK